jgi:hypothetical protein
LIFHHSLVLYLFVKVWDKLNLCGSAFDHKSAKVYDHEMDRDMEPTLLTDPALHDILRELASREPIFHRAAFGRTRADFESMTATDFWEVGASGRRYSRDYVLAVLEKRYQGEYADVWETKDFHCRKLAPDVYLLTYTLLQEERKTSRSTIWEHTESGWKILFHQGTIIQD